MFLSKAQILLRISLILLTGGLLFTSQPGSAINSTNHQLHQLFDKEWNARLMREPLLATRMGLSRTNHLLKDVSEKAYSLWSEKTQKFLSQLSLIDRSHLSEEDLINYQIFKRQLERRISEVGFKTYQMPFLADSGFHTEIMRLHRLVPLKTKQDYHNYIERLIHIPLYFEQNITNMKKGLARQFSMPRVVMKGFTDVITAFNNKDVKSNALWQPFVNMPAVISTSEQSALRDKAFQILKNKVIPSFENLHLFFEKTYIPQTRTSLAASELPAGRQFYQSQVAHYTTLNLTPDEIHNIGLREVARIRREMKTIIEKLRFKGNFKAFLTLLRSSPRFYAKTPEALLKEAAYIAKKMDGQLPRLFSRLPRQPYTVEAVPAEIAPKYTTGRYVSAPINSERPGTYWVNTSILDKRPLYVLEALTLHEAVPGHHLQNALGQEIKNIPEFRRQTYISAFGEGWGLYSERLGLEVGFYNDPYSNFGRLTYEMWRAARLVIDTGIHAKGWSRKRAIKLLEENSALSAHNIRTEVDRYISWPGQALSYKLGEIKIRELRKRAENKLGADFDIRLFHDAILSRGSVPLNVLEQQINRFIEKSKN